MYSPRRASTPTHPLQSARGLWLPVIAFLVAVPAWADSLRGTVVLPTSAESAGDAKSLPPLAYWRVENGVLPIGPAPGEARDCVVLALSPEGEPAKKTGKNKTDKNENGEDPKPLPLSALPSRLSPRVLAVPVGVAIEVRNEDRRPRTLYLNDGETFMPRQATPPGGTRIVKLSVPGDYRISDADLPRLVTTVVVVASPYITTSDEKGAFAIEAPDGKYTLKAWYRGAWTEPQPVEIGGRHPAEIQVKLPAPAPRAERPPASPDKPPAPGPASADDPSAPGPAAPGPAAPGPAAPGADVKQEAK